MRLSCTKLLQGRLIKPDKKSGKLKFEAFGYPFDHKAARFEEALQIITALLRQGEIDFEGIYYQARQCELAPRSSRRGRLLNIPRMS